MNKYAFSVYVVTVWTGKHFNYEQLSVLIESEPNTVGGAFASFGVGSTPTMLERAANLYAELANYETEDEFREAFSSSILERWEIAGGEYPDVEQKDADARRIRKDDPPRGKGSHKPVSGNSRSKGARINATGVQRLDQKDRRRKP